MKRSSLSVATTLLITAQLFACSGDSTTASKPAASSGDESSYERPVSAAHKRGGGSVTALIGEAGGSLELNEGPRVVIPAGAVEEAREYVLQTASLTTAFLNDEHEKPVGPTFVLSPAVYGEGERIEVSLPLASIPDGWGEPALSYEYATGDRVGAEDSQHTRWQFESATYEGGRLVARVNELMGMRLQFVITNLDAQ